MVCSDEVLLPLWEIKIFCLKCFVMCVVQRIMHAGTVSRTQRLDPFSWNRRCDCWNWSQDKKVGHFHFLICLVQVSCNSRIGTTRNKMSMEEKFLGFVLVYKSACTELYGSVRFVKRLNLFWAINRHDWVLQLDQSSVCRHCQHLRQLWNFTRSSSLSQRSTTQQKNKKKRGKFDLAYTLLQESGS